MNNDNKFLDLLIQLRESNFNLNQEEIEKINIDFREFMVSYGSATPDNIQASNLLSIKQCQGLSNYNALQLCLTNHHIAVSDLLYRVESLDIPASISEIYPNLSQDEWNAVFRIAVLILTLFEGKSNNKNT
jgi:hypothetical protein